MTTPPFLASSTLPSAVNFPPSFQLHQVPTRLKDSSIETSHPNFSGGLHSPDVQRLTQVQQSAITLLRNLPPFEVVAWLRLLRCLRHGFRHNGYEVDITREQLDGLSELTGCNDSLVLSWLQSANHSIQQEIQHRSQEASTFAKPLAYSLHPLPTQEKAHLAPAVSEFHKHWCTICDHSEPIETCDGWKRHVREHDISYPCMPNGPVEDTKAGRRCVFCGYLNPDRVHLATHAFNQCRGITGQSKRYTRKVNLINHLQEIHGVEDGQALAKSWRETKRKRSHGCGFCVYCCASLAELTTHIDNEHWKRHANREQWQPATVLLSLLSQPEVHSAWTRCLNSHKVPKDVACTWDQHLITDLQYSLEQRTEDAEILAHRAFRQSSYYQACSDKFEDPIESKHTDSTSNGGWLPLVPQVSPQHPIAEVDYDPSHYGFSSRLSSLPWPSNDAKDYMRCDPKSNDYTDYQSIVSDARYASFHAPTMPSIQHSNASNHEFSSESHSQTQGINTGSDPHWSTPDSTLPLEDNSFSYSTPGPIIDSKSQYFPSQSQSRHHGLDWHDSFDHFIISSGQPDAASTNFSPEPTTQYGRYQNVIPEVKQVLSHVRHNSIPLAPGVPDRRTSPFSASVHKRKHSDSSTLGPDARRETDSDIDIHTGQRAMYRHHDDHLSGRRRRGRNAEYHS